MFFGYADLRGLDLVPSTIAFQLAQLNLQYKRALYDALQEDRNIAASPNLEEQFNGLVRRPLSACEGKQPILIVLDALDQYLQAHNVLKMLHDLFDSDNIGSGGLKLCVLISSTSNSSVSGAFVAFKSEKTDYEEVALDGIDENLMRNDIRLYLESEFTKLSSCDLPKLPKDWPPQEQFSKLHQQSGKTL